jgi:hypothetical protein
LQCAGIDTGDALSAIISQNDFQSNNINGFDAVAVLYSVNTRASAVVKI